MMTDDAYHIKVERYHVNSDLLANIIEEQVRECTTMLSEQDFNDPENIEMFVDSVDYILTRLLYDGKLTTFKNVMDKRNNKRSDILAGNFRLDISYHEKNCLNVTRITFLFSEEEEYKTLTY